MPVPNVAQGAVDGDTALRDWAASGAMSLTGRADGPPLAAPGGPASYVRHLLSLIGDLAPDVRLPGAEVLGERAAYVDVARRGPWSCGGGFRLVPTRDGWFGLSLPRPDDVDLVPALTASPPPGPASHPQNAPRPHDATRPRDADRSQETVHARDTHRATDTHRTSDTRRTTDTHRTPDTHRIPDTHHTPDTHRALDTHRAPGLPGHWEAVSTWAAGVTSAEAVERAALLGLAHADPGACGDPPPAVDIRVLGRREVRERPLVVDLSSLWAGPLCANFLKAAGARVIKVESPRRPDGARKGSPGFFDLLHAGSEFVALDLRHTADVDQLRDLIAHADLVLEASRPRGLAQAGIEAEKCVARGTSWLSITARGRASNTIGFGDDIAASAGFVISDPHAGTAPGPNRQPPAHDRTTSSSPVLLPCGDALADPLTGVTAAYLAFQALRSGEARMIDLPMLAAARAAMLFVPAQPPSHQVGLHDGRWWVETDTGRFPVAAPRPRC